MVFLIRWLTFGVAVLKTGRILRINLDGRVFIFRVGETARKTGMVEFENGELRKEAFKKMH
jgi:hypothetical protein